MDLNTAIKELDALDSAFGTVTIEAKDIEWRSGKIYFGVRNKVSVLGVLNSRVKKYIQNNPKYKIRSCHLKYDSKTKKFAGVISGYKLHKSTVVELDSDIEITFPRNVFIKQILFGIEGGNMVAYKRDEYMSAPYITVEIVPVTDGPKVDAITLDRCRNSIKRYLEKAIISKLKQFANTKNLELDPECYTFFYEGEDGFWFNKEKYTDLGWDFELTDEGFVVVPKSLITVTDRGTELTIPKDLFVQNLKEELFAHKIEFSLESILTSTDKKTK